MYALPAERAITHLLSSCAVYAVLLRNRQYYCMVRNNLKQLWKTTIRQTQPNKCDMFLFDHQSKTYSLFVSSRSKYRPKGWRHEWALVNVTSEPSYWSHQ